MGLVAPSQGRITWGGREDVPPTRRAIVFQRPAMLRRSASWQYPLCFARVRHRSVQNRRAALASFSLWSGWNRSPIVLLAGYRAANSSASRLRVRLPATPHVLFLDEPTASLDPAATKAIEDVDPRRQPARGIKVVMSTHDLGEARRLAGEIIMLHRGRVIETGPAPSFFNTPQTGEAKTFIAGELLV